MSSNIRPRTNNPRGVCMYYTTPRGCFAGSSCKFLHGDPERHDPNDPQPLLTPFDESKRCRYYANGFCRRGNQCWFKHIVDAPQRLSGDIGHKNEDPQDEPCSICFEKPVTYGLLSGCSHIFCITCIRQWRDQKGQIEPGNIKKCPMCREPSRFIIPSSRFWKHGHPEKERITKAYKESMARVPCRYFQGSRQNRPLCPFGKDCFYQHLNEDGTPYVFKNGADICMRQYYNAMRPSARSVFDDIMDFTTELLPLSADSLGIHDGEGIFSMQITADLDAMNPNGVSNTSISSDGSRRISALREDPHIRRQLSILREAMDNLESAVSESNSSVTRTLDMIRALVQHNTPTDADTDHPTETAANHTSESRPTSENEVPSDPSLDRDNLLSPSPFQPTFDDSEIPDDDDDDMPGLQSISNSSSEVYLSDSSESDVYVSQFGGYLRSPASRRPRNAVDRADSEGEDEEARMMQEVAERGPEAVTVAEDDVAVDGEVDEPQLPVMDYETPTVEDEVDPQDVGRVANPPFLTDGRGRVVWSSDGETGELRNPGPRPLAEMGGRDTGMRESQSKCSVLARNISVRENGGESERTLGDEHSR